MYKKRSRVKKRGRKKKEEDSDSSESEEEEIVLKRKGKRKKKKRKNYEISSSEEENSDEERGSRGRRKKKGRRRKRKAHRNDQSDSSESSEEEEEVPRARKKKKKRKKKKYSSNEDSDSGSDDDSDFEVTKREIKYDSSGSDDESDEDVSKVARKKKKKKKSVDSDEDLFDFGDDSTDAEDEEPDKEMEEESKEKVNVSSFVNKDLIGKHDFGNVKKDKFGNPEGSEYDLVKDGAFTGAKKSMVCIVQLYSPSTPIRLTMEALKAKGIQVKWYGSIPAVVELVRILKQCSQFWLIGGNLPSQVSSLTKQHIATLLRFFHAGGGLSIWGDNDPYNAVPNALMKQIPEFSSNSGDRDRAVTLAGYYDGKAIIAHNTGGTTPGIIPSHPIATGLNKIYEGWTIANIEDSNNLLKPLMYASPNGRKSGGKGIVTAYYEKNGRRALVDGGFTRLYDGHFKKTAGTERFVVNSACWLMGLKL